MKIEHHTFKSPSRQRLRKCLDETERRYSIAFAMHLKQALEVNLSIQISTLR